MMEPPYRILVFEDNDENYTKVASPLTEAIDQSRFSIERFSGDQAPPEGDDVSEPLTQLVKNEAKNPEFSIFVILDWDLTMYRNGVSRSHVQRACQELGIPICAYHRDEGRYSNPKELKDYEEDIIKIEKEGDEAAADTFAELVSGFTDIYENLSESEELEPKSKLYDILGAPSVVESKLDQYSWGQSGTIGIAKSSDNEADRIRRMSTFFGYWIHNQLLEYPGALFNEVAAASYLGIDPSQFVSDDTIQANFRQARYDGPFSNLDNWYWEPDIDDVKSKYMESGDKALPEGEVLFERMGIEEIKPVRCNQGHTGAGYYCIIKEEPVCKEHSVQPPNWIPMGASHSRITEEEYDQLSSWMFD